MESFLNKKFKLESSENFEEYMKALGVDMLKRKLASTWHPVVEVTREDGDYWTMSTKSMLRSTVCKFKLGEEFDEERADGVMVKSVITVEGNKMKHVMKGEPESTIIREVNGDEMVVLATVSGVTSKRIYKAQ